MIPRPSISFLVPLALVLVLTLSSAAPASQAPDTRQSAVELFENTLAGDMYWLDARFLAGLKPGDADE